MPGKAESIAQSARLSEDNHEINSMLDLYGAGNPSSVTRMPWHVSPASAGWGRISMPTVAKQLHPRDILRHNPRAAKRLSLMPFRVLQSACGTLS